MDSLFTVWSSRIPKYSEGHKDLFEALCKKGGGEGDKRIAYGKVFSTFYELYIYGFFLGIYSNEYAPFRDGEKKTDFSHHIQHWGSKSKRTPLRKDFTEIQKFIFMACVAKTDVDMLALEKGELSVDGAVSLLISTMEAYTNGGLNLIQDKISMNSDLAQNPTAFIDLLDEHISSRLA